MLINLKVKTLDAQTHEFSIDNELTVKDFKDKVAEKTNIAADQQRIIYCGRVMVDDKQLKEYDVDGKVVHVAERPPPSQRLPSSDSSGSNANPPNERRARGRTGAGGMRNSPLFRALDGMVVGTMAFPMNANTNGQAAVNPFAASSSFCMNRITVARHMLDCANNIAAYLEDPSRGLNNQSLDILARGRWTMESTVVEVGITSDIPQSQQIVEMVQGAVQAALRNSGNTNVTLVQLPTVYSSNENEGNNAAATANADVDAEAGAIIDGAAAPAVEENSSTAAASVLIDDIIDDDEDTPTNEQSNNNSTQASPTTAAASSVPTDDNAASTTNDDGSNDNLRRRTGTPVLAAVIEQMRNVQNRLNPFIEQYHDLLQNEPIFDENDNDGRVNAQRLFDRVSEAFHYMSHAQHAISDLMLDVSQGSPRYLTCRPILVEQSGYVSSNNFLTPTMIPAALRQHQQQQQQQQPRLTTNNTGSATTTSATAATTNSSDNNATASGAGSSRSNSISGSSTSSSNANNSTVDDPIDDPVTWPPTLNLSVPENNGTITNGSNNNASVGRVPAQGGGTLEIVLQPSRAMYLERNLQRQVARLLQDVVSAAPFDTEFHVHINSPNVVSIDVPIGVSASSGVGVAGGGDSGDQASQTSTTTTINNSENNATNATTNDNDSTNTTSNSTSSTASNTANNPARVTTATLPTTSTQTRSTSRPQVHFGNIPVLGMPPGWNGRVLPSNNVSSFDRFLPCNSHHISEPENPTNAANSENGSNANPASSTATPNRSNPPGIANIITRRPLQRMRTPSSRIVGSTMTNAPHVANNDAPRAANTENVAHPNLLPFLVMREMFGGLDAPAAEVSSNPTSSSPASSSPDSVRRNLHKQLKHCLNNQIFEGKPINDETIPPAINRTIQWFGESLLYLPQYEKPEYDSRGSLYNILRNTMPLFIELVQRNYVDFKEFELKLKQICEQFRKRLYSVLYVCVGRDNAEIFWVQLMRLLCNSLQTNLNGDVFDFLTIYFNASIPSATDEVDAEQFLVLRTSSSSISPINNVQVTFVSPPSCFYPQPMDTDVEMTEPTAPTAESEIEDDEPLPSVVPDSATWHRNFPNDWLPIITRDIQRQTENPANQPPYSDAYISGMSSKRRKLVQNSKPPTEIGALIADSVTKAIHCTGLGTSTSSNQIQSPEDIARAISSDVAVQSSCSDVVRSNVRERLKKDPDFEAEKFPKSKKFIQK